MAQISRMGILTAKNGENPKQIRKNGKSGILKMTAEKFLRGPRAISTIVVQKLTFGGTDAATLPRWHFAYRWRRAAERDVKALKHMGSFIHDVIDDPSEYAPVLLFLAGILLLWAALCVSGFLSVHAATRRRSLWFGLVSMILGLPCVCGTIPLSIEAQGFRLQADLRWLFIVPVLLGIGGLASWWRKRRDMVGLTRK
jgi:hypothetical protein